MWHDFAQAVALNGRFPIEFIEDSAAVIVIDLFLGISQVGKNIPVVHSKEGGAAPDF